MSLEPPDDIARTLAKEALAQIRRLDALAKFAGENATDAQELYISLCLRNYFIGRTEADKAKAHEVEP